MLFTQRLGEHGFALPLLINVIHDPYSAFMRCRWVDQMAAQAAPEKVAVAAAQASLSFEGLTLAHADTGHANQRFEIVKRWMQLCTANANYFIMAGKSKNFGEVRIAADDGAIFDECNADTGTVQQGFLFTQ